MGLYERLLAERIEEERHRRRPMGRFYGLDSPALDRLLGNTPDEQLPGGPGGLGLLYRYIHKGPSNLGAVMRYTALKRRFPKEYSELKAEAQGQGELL
jgi:hypothetical protein